MSDITAESSNNFIGNWTIINPVVDKTGFTGEIICYPYYEFKLVPSDQIEQIRDEENEATLELMQDKQLLEDYREARRDIEEGNFEDWTDWEVVKEKIFTADGKAK